MKSCIILRITMLLFSAWVTAATAYTIETSDTITFPTQPRFIYDSTQSYINPFEMTSFSAGSPHIRYHRNISTLDTQWFNSGWSKNIALKIELPFYDKYNSIGLDCTILREPQTSDPHSLFIAILGGDCLATYKLRWPLYTPLGQFAGTITPKGGLVYTMHAVDNNVQHYQQLGFALGTAIGVDYYVNQWFGLFAEWSIQWNRMQFLSQPEYGNAQQDPYHYFTSTITVGFKTTF